MINYVRKLPATTLDRKLTTEPFGHWLTRIAGPDAVINWEVNDCGEQTGSPGDRRRDLPVCVQAEVILPHNAKLYVMIATGTVKGGMRGRPSVKDAFVERNGQTTTVKELSQISSMLR